MLSNLITASRRQIVQYRALLPATRSNISFQRGLRVIACLQEELTELEEDASVEAPIPIDDILMQTESPFKLLSNNKRGDIVLKNGNVSISMNASEYEHSGEEEAAVPFLVYITGADNTQLTLSCVARSNDEDASAELEIEQIVVEPSKGEKPSDPYSPSIGELDEDLKQTFFQYLEERGVNDELAMSLVDIAEQTETNLYHEWVKDVKSFIEKEDAL